jgi:hypothetical protein
LAGTGTPAPMGTTWVFADPTPVWLCFAGIKTRTFEEGTYAASEPILMLRLGDPPDGGAIGFESRPGYGDFSPPKHYPDGGYWTFDPELLGRLCQLLSSTPPTKVGTPRR